MPKEVTEMYKEQVEFHLYLYIRLIHPYAYPPLSILYYRTLKSPPCPLVIGRQITPFSEPVKLHRSDAYQSPHLPQLSIVEPVDQMVIHISHVQSCISLTLSSDRLYYR